MRVVVVTTSYPRHPGDHAGRFVARSVDALRARDVDVDVVAPGRFRDFGLAGGAGLVANTRKRPWAAPAMVTAMVAAVRRAARGADLVHAHWLATAGIAARAGLPYVVTLHGSGTAGRFEDVALCERRPRVVRSLLAPARAVLCVSERLADAVRRAGVDPERVHVVRNGVELPPQPGPPADPPRVLLAGRLDENKGVREFAAATEGLPRIVAGDGPLRALLPDALGFVPYERLSELYAEAAVVALPSFREGLPMVALEALAHGRPVVATPVGGVPEVVRPGETGELVAPGDVGALREALVRLLGDAALRARLGAAGRALVEREFSWDAHAGATVDVYRGALREPARA